MEDSHKIRSWNSISVELRDQIASDDRLEEHKCKEDKVVGL